MNFPKGSKDKVGKSFRAFEFDCRCAHCETTEIDERLIELLEKLRAALGAPIVIMQGYRCATKQQQLRDAGYHTSVGRSSHEDGKAADIRCGDMSGARLAEVAESVGFEAIGIAGKWIHVDTRTGKRRRWPY